MHTVRIADEVRALIARARTENVRKPLVVVLSSAKSQAIMRQKNQRRTVEWTPCGMSRTKTADMSFELPRGAS